MYVYVCCGIWKVRWENIVLNVRKPELDPMIFSQAELELELFAVAVAVSWSWSKKVPPLRASGSTVRRVLRHRVPRLCGVADKWLRSHRGRRTAESRGGFRVSTGGKKVETAFWLVLTSETRELSWLQVYLVSHTHTHRRTTPAASCGRHRWASAGVPLDKRCTEQQRQQQQQADNNSNNKLKLLLMRTNSVFSCSFSRVVSILLQ